MESGPRRATLCFFEGWRGSRRSSWGRSGSKVAPKGIQDAINWPCLEPPEGPRLQKCAWLGEFFHQKVDFAKCMKNTMKIHTFSRFERSSWSHLGSLKGVRTEKVALQRASFGDWSAKVGQGRVSCLPELWKPSGNQVQIEGKSPEIKFSRGQGLCIWPAI